VVKGSLKFAVQLLITFLVLFYFFRDHRPALEALRKILPLSHAEAGELFKDVDDTIYATIYGTLLVALIQGTLGGLMFWWLGLTAPLLWGIAMALLATVPILGAFVIWIPAAIYLALEGQWIKAVILTVWGTVVIGLIDNLLYPVFVGQRLRLHTLPVFISILGGLLLFGASGLILGPMTLAITLALLNVWRRRTARGGTVEQGIHESRTASRA
ncbi:MAG: AI-2E family transporter, partial [Verrucomicrobiales bacterium]|nr:AI-2E family transporter [Verrucomicrobiales bacterium]